MDTKRTYALSAGANGAKTGKIFPFTCVPVHILVAAWLSSKQGSCEWGAEVVSQDHQVGRLKLTIVGIPEEDAHDTDDVSGKPGA
ncbi:hypothetical protein P7K49_021048 [Saguinus oedipus]|uniref:Uncharacterized protein n=1 Tax=Saguinus oedipus TaxID=9490 RepID=A0ABQ9US98_SAGOE|nr:hypothetical protein P7K49_021048 [Saguinus oedipus]